jgi:hypothetical protein
MDEAAGLFSAVSACGMRSSPMGLLGTTLETPAVPTIEQQKVGRQFRARRLTRVRWPVNE